MRYRLRTLLIVLAIGMLGLVFLSIGCDRPPSLANSAHPKPSPTTMTTKQPTELVVEFFAAYNSWNTAAIERSKNAGDERREAATKTSVREYDELIARFCVPSVKPQGIAYGDDSSHDPERETIESVAVEGQTAIVRTKHVGFYNFISRYEYHLVVVNGEWKLASLLYVDEDGKYECL